MIKKVILDKADRLYHFPLDLEESFPKRMAPARERKYPLIDLGHFRWPIGPETVIGKLEDSLAPASEEEIFEFKEALSVWLKSQFGIRVNARREIYLGQGIRRILSDFCLAFVETDDIVLCPEPGIPFYKRQVITAGGIPVSYSLSERTEYKPSLRQLSAKLGKASRVMVINNPHNPYGTILEETDLAELIRMASRENLFLFVDAAYASLAEEKYIPLAGLPGGRKVALEVFSVPFLLGLGYCPLGFAIGAPEIINGLKIMGQSLGNYFPRAWVKSAHRALENYPSPAIRDFRRDISQARHEAGGLVERLMGRVTGGKSAPFIWMKVPGRRMAQEYASLLLRRKNILVLPGHAFGESGEGYIRLSLTCSAEDYHQAASRMTGKTGLGINLEE